MAVGAGVTAPVGVDSMAREAALLVELQQLRGARVQHARAVQGLESARGASGALSPPLEAGLALQRPGGYQGQAQTVTGATPASMPLLHVGAPQMGYVGPLQQQGQPQAAPELQMGPPPPQLRSLQMAPPQQMGPPQMWPQQLGPPQMGVHQMGPPPHQQPPQQLAPLPQQVGVQQMGRPPQQQGPPYQPLQQQQVGVQQMGPPYQPPQQQMGHATAAAALAQGPPQQPPHQPPQQQQGWVQQTFPQPPHQQMGQATAAALAQGPPLASQAGQGQGAAAPPLHPAAAPCASPPAQQPSHGVAPSAKVVSPRPGLPLAQGPWTPLQLPPSLAAPPGPPPAAEAAEPPSPAASTAEVDAAWSQICHKAVARLPPAQQGTPTEISKSAAKAALDEALALWQSFAHPQEQPQPAQQPKEKGPPPAQRRQSAIFTEMYVGAAAAASAAAEGERATASATAARGGDGAAAAATAAPATAATPLPIVKGPPTTNSQSEGAQEQARQALRQATFMCIESGLVQGSLGSAAGPAAKAAPAKAASVDVAQLAGIIRRAHDTEPTVTPFSGEAHTLSGDAEHPGVGDSQGSVVSSPALTDSQGTKTSTHTRTSTLSGGASQSPGGLHAAPDTPERAAAAAAREQQQLRPTNVRASPPPLKPPPAARGSVAQSSDEMLTVTHNTRPKGCPPRRNSSDPSHPSGSRSTELGSCAKFGSPNAHAKAPEEGRAHVVEANERGRSSRPSRKRRRHRADAATGGTEVVEVVTSPQSSPQYSLPASVDGSPWTPSADLDTVPQARKRSRHRRRRSSDANAEAAAAEPLAPQEGSADVAAGGGNDDSVMEETGGDAPAGAEASEEAVAFAEPEAAEHEEHEEEHASSWHEEAVSFGAEASEHEGRAEEAFASADGAAVPQGHECANSRRDVEDSYNMLRQSMGAVEERASPPPQSSMRSNAR